MKYKIAVNKSSNREGGEHQKSLACVKTFAKLKIYKYWKCTLADKDLKHLQHKKDTDIENAHTWKSCNLKKKKKIQFKIMYWWICFPVSLQLSWNKDYGNYPWQQPTSAITKMLLLMYVYTKFSVKLTVWKLFKSNFTSNSCFLIISSASMYFGGPFCPSLNVNVNFFGRIPVMLRFRSSLLSIRAE